MANTGNTSTIAHSSLGGLAAACEVIDPAEMSVEDIDYSKLSTTNQKVYKASDLVEGGDISLNCQFDASLANSVLGTSATATITFAGSAVGTMTGSAYVKSFKAEEVSNDAKPMATVVLKFDGVTPVTYT